MIRVRTRAALLAVVCGLGGPALGQTPPPRTEAEPPTVVLEARWFRVPAGFCDRTLGAAAPAMHGCTALTEPQARAFLDAVQGERTADILQAPKMTVFSGEQSTVRIADTRQFVTGLETKVVNGTAVLVPRNEPVAVGPALAVRPSVSGRYINLELKASRPVVEKVARVPVTTMVTPVFEGGSQGVPVPFTQFIETPTVQDRHLAFTVPVRNGGTAAIRGWTEAACEPEAKTVPVLSDIPYINRLFKVAKPATLPAEVVLLVTARELEATHVEVPVPAQVVMQMVVAEVPEGFTTEVGLAMPGVGKECFWVLTEREARLFQSAIKAGKAAERCDVLAAPRLVTLDRQTGFFKVGSDDIGFNSRVTPTVSADGKTVTVQVECKNRVCVPANGIRLASGTEVPGYSEQSLKAMAELPFGGTFVIGGMQGTTRDGKGRETIVILTAEPISGTRK